MLHRRARGHSRRRGQLHRVRSWSPALWLPGKPGHRPHALTLKVAIWLNSDMADDEAPVFRALADPTRRQILEDLRDGELSAGDIASRFPIKGPSVSRHLSILKGAGLISERREANRILYSVASDRLPAGVGGVPSAGCPEQVVLRRRREKRPAGDAP